MKLVAGIRLDCFRLQFSQSPGSEELEAQIPAMNLSISHNRADESMRAKAEWFQSLSVEERMDVFVEMMDVVIGLNPSILDSKDAKPIPGRVRVLELPRS